MKLIEYGFWFESLYPVGIPGDFQMFAFTDANLEFLKKPGNKFHVLYMGNRVMIITVYQKECLTYSIGSKYNSNVNQNLTCNYIKNLLKVRVD